MARKMISISPWAFSGNAATRFLRATYFALAILLCVSLGSMISLNYFRCTTDTEPYVYVQTYNDIFKLTEPQLKLARRDPKNYHRTGHMIRGSVYPLPWILGDFTHIGYYEHGEFLRLEASHL